MARASRAPPPGLKSPKGQARSGHTKRPPPARPGSSARVMRRAPRSVSGPCPALPMGCAASAPPRSAVPTPPAPAASRTRTWLAGRTPALIENDLGGLGKVKGTILLALPTCISTSSSSRGRSTRGLRWWTDPGPAGVGHRGLRAAWAVQSKRGCASARPYPARERACMRARSLPRRGPDRTSSVRDARATPARIGGPRVRRPSVSTAGCARGGEKGIEPVRPSYPKWWPPSAEHEPLADPSGGATSSREAGRARRPGSRTPRTRRPRGRDPTPVSRQASPARDSVQALPREPHNEGDAPSTTHALRWSRAAAER